MQIQLSAIPQNIIYQYHLEAIKHDVWVYIDIHKDMPGLKQSCNIANDCLYTHIKIHGYAPVQHTNTLWTNETGDIIFTLLVGEFLIKFTSSQYSEHLSSAL